MSEIKNKINHEKACHELWNVSMDQLIINMVDDVKWSEAEFLSRISYKYIMAGRYIVPSIYKKMSFYLGDGCSLPSFNVKTNIISADSGSHFTCSLECTPKLGGETEIITLNYRYGDIYPGQTNSAKTNFGKILNLISYYKMNRPETIDHVKQKAAEYFG
jgi:hypothetical protein